MKNLITREYNGVEVHFEIIDGESYVAIEDVARFCGWTDIKNGKEYMYFLNFSVSFALKKGDNKELYSCLIADM